ncbi:hypothetical protein [Rhizobium sp. FKY42]|uniref:hypothetical protein n=1 Tax=Rhizobium sp. FKY42 TaxID=2562310 RepID=UPI0010C1326D|nr:hypothetical protein [Rhizobium sp. FKY42]
MPKYTLNIDLGQNPQLESLKPSYVIITAKPCHQSTLWQTLSRPVDLRNVTWQELDASWVGTPDSSPSGTKLIDELFRDVDSLPIAIGKITD